MILTMVEHRVPVSLPGPGELLTGARAAGEWAVRGIKLVAGLPERAGALLDGAEKLISRIDDLADQVQRLVDRVDALATETAAVVVSAEQVAGGASSVLVNAHRVTGEVNQMVGAAGVVTDRADQISAAMSELVATYQPIAAQAAPLARAVVDELAERELTATVRLVDHLPGLAQTVETEVIPVLTRLDRVGPDMHELLLVVKDLRSAINGIPGLAYLRRRARPEDQ
ncbi:MAG TPA: hypothetical protein VFE65_10075 [Pseudonocardia sp.]|jgi:ABC-type transporter Mla subunit MlaD|nr:hypothetical protein [Pseudonocardia sp.]